MVGPGRGGDPGRLGAEGKNSMMLEFEGGYRFIKGWGSGFARG